MTRREAQQLAKQIERDDEYMRVDGLRHYDGGGYAVEVTDERTGYAIVINTKADWEYRQMETDRQRRDIGSTDLLARGDIAALAGVAPNTINQWILRFPDFPAPFAKTSGGDIWLRGPVVEWLKRTGRLPDTL